MRYHWVYRGSDDYLARSLPVVRKLVRWRTNKAVGDPTAVLTLGSHMGAVPTAGMPVVFMPTTPVAPGGDDPDFYSLPSRSCQLGADVADLPVGRSGCLAGRPARVAELSTDSSRASAATLVNQSLRAGGGVRREC